jgi:putative endonuclease
MADPRRGLGTSGELLAERFLVKLGLKRLARNFSTPTGELDLIMRDGDCIVFVEVKTLTDPKFSDPVDQLRPAQQRKLIQTANWWRSQKRCAARPCRFDVIGVAISESDAEPEITHIKDAFGPRNGW